MKPTNRERIALSRRSVLGGMAAGVAAAAAPLSLLSSAARGASPAYPQPPAVTPDVLAKDEGFWRQVGEHYDRTQGIVNLEHGYWGKMARPVQDAYLAATTMVNSQSSFYARRDYGDDHRQAVERIAGALGADPEEIVLTRNATESIQNLVLQYRDLDPGDEVLYADIDYPSFKRLLRSLESRRGVRAVALNLPARATQAEILSSYVEIFDARPALKLMLLTHVSNQHGLVLPVAEIAREARSRGIDVICDSAQSWGLIDYRVGDLGVDWAGFNLHKWIGAPLGLGVLYMRRGTLSKISPYPGEDDADDRRAATRVHSGTGNFAAVLSVPTALDFHEAIGGANKEARLRYLRGLWTVEADKLAHIEVLGGADEASWTGIGSFRLRGKASAEDARALQARLETDFGIFTVARFGLADGACVRITPQVFTSPQEIAQLSDALQKLRA